MTVVQEANGEQGSNSDVSINSLEYDEHTAEPFKLEREDSDHFDDLNALPFRGLGLVDNLQR